jgi:hypothetical protein
MAKRITTVHVHLPGYRRRKDGTLEQSPQKRVMSRDELVRRLGAVNRESCPDALVGAYVDPKTMVAHVAVYDPDTLACLLSDEEIKQLDADSEEYPRQQLGRP